MPGITDLIVWREAADLVEEVSALCREFRGPGALKAADQLVSAAESITANIAEAYGRGVRPEGLQFLRFAKGSADEVESRLLTSVRAGRATMHRVTPLVDHTRRVQYLVRRFAESVERRIGDKAEAPTS